MESLEPVIEPARRLWQRVSEGGFSCSPIEAVRSVDCTIIVVPETSRLARFAKNAEESSPGHKKKDKSVMIASSQSFGLMNKSSEASGLGSNASHGEDGSGEEARTLSEHGIGEDGEITPTTKRTAVEAMRSVLERAEFTPRSARDGEEDQDEVRRLQNRFLEAARASNFRGIVQGLVDGVDVDCRTLRGQNALMLAAGARNKGALQVIGFLLEVKVSPETIDNAGWTPLLYACRNNIHEAAEMLLKSKAIVGTRSNDGQTAAMLAANESGDELVISLVGYKAGLERADRKGWTLLFYAVENGRDDLVKWLLKKKANVDAKSKDRTTCLMVAAEGGHLKIGKQLVSRNANVNVKNVVGNTALLLSVMSGEEKFALYLIEANADCVVKNKDGLTAVMVASQMRMGSLKNTLDVMSRKAQDRGKMLDDDDDDN